MGDGISESCASSLAKGFVSTAPAWLAQAQPCAFLPIRVNPSHLTRSFPLPRLLGCLAAVYRTPAPVLGCGSKNNFAVNDFAKMECRETRVQRRELLPPLTFTLPRHAHCASIFFNPLFPKTIRWHLYSRFHPASQIPWSAEQTTKEELPLRDIATSPPPDCGLRVQMSRDRSHRRRIE